MIRKLTPKDYRSSEWSGGRTTQIAIYPPEAEYAKRSFLWRVSSATVELEDSDFTPLPDYERLIATLAGEIALTHNGGAPMTLRPLEVHAFSGADATHSQGRCTDFNLMLRRGRVSGSMEALRLTESPASLNVGTSVACPPSASIETVLLYCAEGEASVGLVKTSPASGGGGPSSRAVEGCRRQPGPASPDCHSERSEAESKNPFSPVSLSPGEALLVTDPASMTLTGPAVVMVCRITSP